MQPTDNSNTNPFEHEAFRSHDDGTRQALAVVLHNTIKKQRSKANAPGPITPACSRLTNKFMSDPPPIYAPPARVLPQERSATPSIKCQLELVRRPLNRVHTLHTRYTSSLRALSPSPKPSCARKPPLGKSAEDIQMCTYKGGWTIQWEQAPNIPSSY